MIYYYHNAYAVAVILYKSYLFHRQPVGVHSLLVLERSHESLDDVANVEHANSRATDRVHGRVEHTVDDRVDDAGQSRVQYVTGILCIYTKTRREICYYRSLIIREYI